MSLKWKIPVTIVVICVVAIAAFTILRIEQTEPHTGLTVYCREDAENIQVYHPHMQIRIVKPRGTYQPGGRIDTLNFNGTELVKTVDPKFGAITLLSASNVHATQAMYPNTMSVASIEGNNTGRLVITLATASVTLYDGTGELPVSVHLEYTLFADTDNILIWATIDSDIVDWRVSSITYGQSLNLRNFETYEVKGTRNTMIGQGNLTGSRQTFQYMATSVQTTLTDSLEDVAVTVFPLGLFPSFVNIQDGTDSTIVYMQTIGARTYDGAWYDWGEYIRNIIYGTVIAVGHADTRPNVVTPWLMPNAVPYGIMQSYDELPQDTYNRTQPIPETDTYNFWYWHEQNPQRRLNLMLGLDMMGGGDAPPTVRANGVDNTWEIHGTKRLSDASQQWKEWLKNIESTWVGFGIHAYHHDFPWLLEFSGVTNTTWIGKTWDQIDSDIMDIGLKNQTWFKPAGYRMRPEGLDALTAHGIKAYNVNYNAPPTAIPWYLYVDADGRQTILFSNSLTPDTLFSGQSPSYVYENMIRGNFTKMGLLSMSGHFLNETLRSKWNELFTVIEKDFNFDYFLVDEIVGYWHDVLLPLKYTYNSTQIFANINDPRLTFRLVNSPIPTTSGLQYEDTTFTLYCPNVETSGFIFKRLSGYSSLSSVSYAQNTLNFWILSPADMVGITEIEVTQNLTTSTVMMNGANINISSARSEFDVSRSASWFYDLSSRTLHIKTRATTTSTPTSVAVSFVST